MRSRLAERLHLDTGEFDAARAIAESKPLPTQPVRKPLGWGRDMLTYLRAQDTTPAGLGMHRPAAPAPRPLPHFATIAYLTAVSTAINADYQRHLDTLRVIDDISAAFTEHPELLTADGHPGPRLWLRRIIAELAPFADAVKAQVA